MTHKQVGGFADSSLLLEGEKKGTRYGQKRKLEDKGAVRKVYQNSESIMYLKLIAQSFIQSCFNGNVPFMIHTSQLTLFFSLLRMYYERYATGGYKNCWQRLYSISLYC